MGKKTSWGSAGSVEWHAPRSAKKVRKKGKAPKLSERSVEKRRRSDIKKGKMPAPKKIRTTAQRAFGHAVIKNVTKGAASAKSKSKAKGKGKLKQVEETNHKFTIFSEIFFKIQNKSSKISF